MTSAPRVSVVIPAYNASSFIASTLETVAAQTFRDFEVVVVDDGSSDDTAAVVDAFLRAKGLPGKAVRQPNKKIAGARNTGVREARGSLIAFLDHDDAWTPDHLSSLVAELDAHPEADLVCCDEKITEKGVLLRVHHNGPASERMYERLLMKGNALSPSCVLVRKSRLDEVGGFREDPVFNTVEDYDLWMRLARVCRFRFLPRVLGEYHFEERGASRRVVYHHTNLEHLLKDHFRTFYGERPGFLDGLRMRRRLAGVYRSALGLLATYSEDKVAQKDYALKMMRTFPFDPKNAYRFLRWAIR